jgi:hypothetical protein
MKGKGLCGVGKCIVQKLPTEEGITGKGVLRKLLTGSQREANHRAERLLVARKEGILQQGVPEDSFLQFGSYYVDSTHFPVTHRLPGIHKVGVIFSKSCFPSNSDVQRIKSRGY